MAGPSDVFSVLFNSVLNDLKGSSSTWESISSKAVKLSTQLNNVANSLLSFSDVMQSISDNANNVKGASRDIGASLTRFCIRQKSIEKLIRNFATVLCDSFAPSIEKKVGDWRQRVINIERRRIRNLKKWKQKSSSGSEQFSESRSSYFELLTEQRNQFIFFVNALLPIMDAEIDLFDEGAHVRQIRNSVASTANENDSHCIIKAIIEDAQANFGSTSNVSGSSLGGISKNDEDLWQRRMSTCGNNNTLSKNSNQALNILKKSLQDNNNNNSNLSSSSGFSQSLHNSFTSNIGSKNTLDKSVGSFCDLNVISSQSNTFASVKSADNVKRLPVTPQNFLPFYSEFGKSHNSSVSPTLKPPLPIRQIQRPSDIPNSVYSIPLNNSLSISANDLTENNRCNSRPLSLSGCDLQNNNLYKNYEHITTNKLQKQNSQEENRSSNLLIAETLHQIDQLGVELDSYCRTLKPVTSNEVFDNLFTGNNNNSNTLLENNALIQNKMLDNDSSSVTSSFPQQSTIKVRYRPDNIKPPPPLPERRNSTITAATPTAPSIVDIRTNSGNCSTGIYQQPQLRSISQGTWSVPPSNISQTTNNNIVKRNEIEINKTVTQQFQQVQERNQLAQENQIFLKYSNTEF